MSLVQRLRQLRTSPYARPDAMGNFFFVSHSKKFMFLSVSKNACTSLKQLLYRLELGRDFHNADGKDIHNFWGFQAREGVLIDRRDQHQLARYPDYVRFAVLRDPVARFMSTYHNKVAYPPAPHVFYRRNGLEGMALDPFLDVAEQVLRIRDPLQIDEHLRPQSCFYQPDDVRYIVPIGLLDAFLDREFGVRNVPRINTVTGVRTVPDAAQTARIRRMYRNDYRIVPNYPPGA